MSWKPLAAAAAALLLASTVQAAVRHPKSLNPVNDKLLKLPPAEQVADLARAVGHWCIGTQAFPMGVIPAGQPGAGNAYWSLRCADGAEWAVQIDPAAHFVAITCKEFSEFGAGKECFKKF